MKRLLLSAVFVALGVGGSLAQVETRTSWPTPPPERLRPELELRIEEDLAAAERRTRTQRLYDLLDAVTADPHAYRCLVAVKRLQQQVGQDGREREISVAIKDAELVGRLLRAEGVLDGYLEGK